MAEMEGTMLLRLEDIEEFELVRRIPRQAITSEILEGIKLLDERTQIEQFIREILPDETNTPHGPTELADILTPHITQDGKSKFAAFVNKGKAYPKVTSKEVAHQISRARRIPDINLLVLLAVGDIQDDIRADLITAANDAKADYMFVDAIDVARLFIAYHKVCPNDGSVYTDEKCSKCGLSADQPLAITLKIYEEPKYEILEHHDDSHGMAKRYSADILTSSHYSKMILREIIRDVTWKLRHSTYQASNQAQKLFKDRQADVVRLFVYFTMTDRQQVNWYCRTLWINPALPDTAKPMSFSEKESFGDIQINWKSEYESHRILFAELQEEKGVWWQRIQTLSMQVVSLYDDLQNWVKRYQNKQIEANQLEEGLAELETKAARLFMQAGEKSPPLDCKDCHQAFIEVTSHLHNILVPFGRLGKAKWTWEQKLNLSNRYFKDFSEALQRFAYEWKKSTGREFKFDYPL